MIRCSKWKSCDHDIRERFSRNINSCPKTISSKKHTRFTRTKLFQHTSPREFFSLHEQCPSFFIKERLHLLGQRLHGPIARKENKGACFALLCKMSNPMF